MRSLPLSDLHCGRALAPDERVTWEGGPSWAGLALDVFHVRIVAGYFGLVTCIGLVEAARGHASWQAALTPLLPGLATIGMLAGLAVLVARSTRYLVTSDRIILRYGFIFPRSLSIPFRQIASLSVSIGRGGRGNVSFGLLRSRHTLPYQKLWPHVRAWRLTRPEPMLRDIAEVGLAATRLSRQLSGAERERAEQKIDSVKAPWRPDQLGVETTKRDIERLASPPYRPDATYALSR